MTRPSSLPATAKITSTFCGTITGVSLAACERSSADMVDQPSPADDCSSVEVEYFLDPWVERSICGSPASLVQIGIENSGTCLACSSRAAALTAALLAAA
jgi:hypothetical protein